MSRVAMAAPRDACLDQCRIAQRITVACSLWLTSLNTITYNDNAYPTNALPRNCATKTNVVTRKRGLCGSSRLVSGGMWQVHAR
jgi:hypothetical protein